MTGAWLSAADCRLEDFRALVEVTTSLDDYPHAAEVVANIPVYEGPAVVDVCRQVERRRQFQSELVKAFMDGPGVVVFRRAFADSDVVARVSAVFGDIIADEKQAGGPAGDHFGKPGANDRIWNALEKLALRAPDLFVEYYSNDIIAVASQAWLGPAYQVTSQVNVVNPGGQAQLVHRDYHLGFQSNEVSEQYPAHVHRLSATLTLQGAVAHCDMPLASGPTLMLPHSQKYLPGYLAWRLPEFREYFDSNYVQLPLNEGDVVFFNPALFHAAGTNTTSDVRRMANLLQVSSAFGRAMESVDRTRIVDAIFDDLRKHHLVDGTHQALGNAIDASAEGYAFPTNLDHDQPVDGLAPPSAADILRRALDEEWDHERLSAALAARDLRTQA